MINKLVIEDTKQVVAHVSASTLLIDKHLEGKMPRTGFEPAHSDE